MLFYDLEIYDYLDEIQTQELEHEVLKYFDIIKTRSNYMLLRTKGVKKATIKLHKYLDRKDYITKFNFIQTREICLE